MALGIPHRQSYPPIVRDFCIGLRNTSPAAYKFVRSEFENHLPHPWTITSWHVNSDINCEPGVIKHSMEILKRKVAEKGDKKLFGALLFDEVSIRKHMQFVNGQMYGFENIPGMNRIEADVATHALVYMFSALNDNFRLPVAYNYITTIDAKDKMELLKEVMKPIIDAGVELKVIVFDGFKTNSAMCRLLGANLDEFNPFFWFQNMRIAVMLDFSHAEKLVRGTLGAYGVIRDGDNGEVNWEYFKRLVQFKDKRHFAFHHKLTQAHINYDKNPMKVKLAVETFSDSTANAMEFLHDEGYPEFAGAKPSIRFSRMFNRLWDVCNSTDDTKENPLKNPMSPKNIDQIFQLFDEATQYIKALQVKTDKGKWINVCKSEKKAGCQGFLINIYCLREIYNDIVHENQYVDCIATHSFSQDHLEILFGKIRSLNGFNNNPTCQQFDAALRKIMANTTILYSESGNCSIQNSVSVYNPYSNISFVTSRRATIKDTADISDEEAENIHGDEVEILMEQLGEIQSLDRGTTHTDMSSLTISHIAGMIEWRIKNSSRFQCQLCKEVLDGNERIVGAFMNNQHSIRPCRSSAEICSTADHFLKIELLKGQFKLSVIHYAIIRSLDIPNLYPDSDFQQHLDHKLFLVKHIVSEFIRIKGIYLAKTYSFKEKQEQMRQKLSKLILHYHT